MNFHVCCFLLLFLILANAAVYGPLTPDFVHWLNSNGYSNYSFNRPDLGNTGSFGGRRFNAEEILLQPVVFVHGNSDGALAIPGNYSSGWTNTIEYFQSMGYRSCELFVTTWGDRDPAHARYHGHTCEYLLYVRNFVQAVLDYTGVPLIDVIAHSMGVTIARRVIKGGVHYDKNGFYCNLGDPLTARVDSFLGIAGANLGMCTCSGLGDDNYFQTCNSKNGFWPGDPCSPDFPCASTEEDQTCPNGPKYSNFLTELNEQPILEGSHIFSVWSLDDDILTNSGIVFARPTALIPNSACYKIYSTLTHMQSKELTAKDQYQMVVYHSC